MTKHEPKISVVVPIHNIGRDLHGLVASLDLQTLPADEFEVVLVDDGSTDDTLSVAQGFAVDRPGYTVVTMPNSGWPGKPRNVGTSLARGRYVFYADDDDEFSDGALAALYETAERNAADIVYGKIVRVGHPTPYWDLWRRDVAVADLAGAPVVSRTVHKLFRRQFLVDHELRFREGKVRLEDHQFMAQAIPRARTISILASVPVYRWIFRDDAGSISKSSSSHAQYWGDYGEVLATWERTSGPGPILDSARVAAMTQAFSRFPPSSYLKRAEKTQRSLVDALGNLVNDHFPASLDDRMTVWRRLAVIALRRRDKELFDAVQAARMAVTLKLTTVGIASSTTTLSVTLQAEMWARTRFGKLPVILLGRGSRARLPLPKALRVRFDDDARRLDSEALGEIEVTVRHRDTGIEWPVSTQRQTSRSTHRLRVVHHAEVDLSSNPFGAALDVGIWDVLARVRFLGEGSLRRVEVPQRFGRNRLTGPAPYATKAGMLAFRVTAPSAEIVEATWREHDLVLRFDHPVSGELVYRARDSTDFRFLPVADDTVVVERAALPLGSADFWIQVSAGNRHRLRYAGPVVEDTDSATVARVYTTKHGSLSLVVRSES